VTGSRQSLRPDGQPKLALFTAIPAIGHINPLLMQARELHRRGWRVALASTERVRGHVERFGEVCFVDLGSDPLGMPAFEDLQARVSAETSFLRGTIRIMRWVNGLWPTMFDGLMVALLHDRPDVVVADLVTIAGLDAAEQMGIAHVINNADLLTAISVEVLPPAPDVPLLFSGHSIHRIGRMDRSLNPFWRRVGATVFNLTLGVELNRLRRDRGLPPRRFTRRHRGKLVMTNSAFGLEYNRVLPPLLQMVGPMLEDTPDALPRELEDWLGQARPVVFVNLGTLARPQPDLVQKVAAGLASDAFRVLWVLREATSLVFPPNVRVEPWVASQVGVLAHPNVRLFVSHCGINSAQESLYWGTPVVGIPMLADQRDMAMRVQDASVGQMLDKNHFTAHQLRSAIGTVLNDPAYGRNIPAIQSSFRLAGGARRAADLIEHAAASGTVR